MQLDGDKEKQEASSHYEAMIQFIDGVYDYNFYHVIEEKVKQFEIDGWKACLDGPFSPFKMKADGKYQVTFIRKSDN